MLLECTHSRRHNFSSAWLADLGEAHEEALRSLLAAAAAAQVSDLTWRRDIALEADVGGTTGRCPYHV